MLYFRADLRKGAGHADTVYGQEGNDTLIGGLGDDSLYGQDGDDQLFGQDGDDLLNGGFGPDFLDGGPGIDTASFADFDSGVAVNLQTNIGWKAAAGDSYHRIENLEGSPLPEVLAGDSLANRIHGGDGVDKLFGQAGDDILIGGTGADLLNGGPGSDTASYADATAGVGVNLQNNIGWGAAAGDSYQWIENLEGSAYPDILAGDVYANRIQGGDGADQLFGQAGDDILLGGPGADALNGGPGIDTASYADASSGVGVNLFTRVGWGAATGDLYQWIENLEGSAHQDILAGDSHANRIKGGDGADKLFGQAGDDILIGGPGADVLNGGPGTDTASYTTADAGVGVNLLNGIGWGAAAGDSYQWIENLEGSAHQDILAGDGLANRIEGGDGADKLFGQAGDDTLIGGAGSDELNGGLGNDRFVFADGFGLDTIIGFAALNDLEKIDLSTVTNITDFADLAANHLTQNGAHAVITDGGGTITLLNVQVANLDANDFLF